MGGFSFFFFSYSMEGGCVRQVIGLLCLGDVCSWNATTRLSIYVCEAHNPSLTGPASSEITRCSSW